MKIIIAGGRDINDYEIVKTTIEDSPFNKQITEVISGGCRGIDMLGQKWAEDNNIPFRIFFPDWDIHGKSAGPIRNENMIKKGNADGLIIIWDGKSIGSKNMKKLAQKYNIKIYEKIINL